MNEKALDSSADVALILILPIALLIIFLMATWPVLLAGVVLYFSVNYWQRYRWQKWCKQVNPIFHQLLKENRGSITALELAMKTSFSAPIANRYLESKAQEFGAQYQDYEDRGRVYYFITASTLGKILDDSEPPTQPQPNEPIMPLSESHNRLQLEGATPTEEQATSLLTDSFEPSLEQLEPVAHSRPRADLLQSEDSIRLKEESPPLEQNHLSQLEDATPTPMEATSISADTDEILEQVEPAHHVQSALTVLLQAELAKRLDVHSSTVYKRRDDPDFPQWSRSKDPEGIAWKFLPDTKQFCPLDNLE